MEATKADLFSEVKKYIHSKVKDVERIQTFAKILINGLSSSKFISKKDCIYTPPKVLVPKTDVIVTYLEPKRQNIVH